MDGGRVLSGGCRLEGGGWGGGSWRWGGVWEGGGGCMEFVQSVSQVLYHVNTGVALHAALVVQDRRLLANTHWPSTSSNTKGTWQFLDLNIT